MHVLLSLQSFIANTNEKKRDSLIKTLLYNLFPTLKVPRTSEYFKVDYKNNLFFKMSGVTNIKESPR